MESTLIETTPAKAALSALEQRAQNGEKVTAQQLVQARAEVDLEELAAQGRAHAEVERKAKERAQKIADLNERTEAIKAENTLEPAREKLAAAIEDYGRVCVDYYSRRNQIVAESHKFPTTDEGEDLKKLQINAGKIAKPYMKTRLDEIAQKKLAHYYGRTSWERADW